MIKYFFLYLLCFSLLAQPLPARGDTTLVQEDLEKIFKKICFSYTPEQIEEIIISDFSSQPATLTVPEGEIDYEIINQPSIFSPGKKFISVKLLVNAREYGKVSMHGNLHYWGTVVTAAKNLRRHTILSKEDLETDFRDISMLGDRVASLESAIGKKLKKGLHPGSILYNSLLKNPDLVKRGDSVTIMAKSGSLEVAAPGEARSAGSRGELIRVKNLMSRRLLQARVVTERLVEVEL